MKSYELYVLDCETTGLDPVKNDIIELSIYRLSNDSQKTWLLKPINIDAISEDALRVNKHKIEDLKGLTKYGKDIYLEPKKVIIEIENWLMDDMKSSDEKLMIGHNVSFDRNMLRALWDKCGSSETFPFNKKYVIDTMQLEYMKDLASNEEGEGYSLFHLCKKYGIKNEQAHSASSDTRSTVAVFRKQLETFKKAFSY